MNALIAAIEFRLAQAEVERLKALEAPAIAGEADAEYKTRLDADQVSMAWKSGNVRKPTDLAGSPLFPVEKERGLFDAE